MTKILAISGSLRSQSSHEKLLKAAVQLAPSHLQIELYTRISELPFFNPDLDNVDLPSEVWHFRQSVKAAQGLFISSPEYAHGVPGVLKNALDWLVSFPDFENKPIAFICGGQFAPLQLEEILRTMSAKILCNFSVSTAQLRQAFDQNGNLADKNMEKSILESLKRFENLK